MHTWCQPWSLFSAHLDGASAGQAHPLAPARGDATQTHSNSTLHATLVSSFLTPPETRVGNPFERAVTKGGPRVFKKLRSSWWLFPTSMAGSKELKIASEAMPSFQIHDRLLSLLIRHPFWGSNFWTILRSICNNFLRNLLWILGGDFFFFDGPMQREQTALWSNERAEFTLVCGTTRYGS